MLKGIDISNWQAGLIPSELPIDFCICKATEGTTFVDRYCDGFIQDCISNNILWGFYHFAKNDDPNDEADFFIENTANYFGHGIPVLDWEDGQSVWWVNTFVNRIHDRMGVWPWIYGNPWLFNQGGVESNCMRWVASYPNVSRPTLDYDPGDPPETDGLVGCWQYASDGYVPGYSGYLDVNHFYGDRGTWLAYVGTTEEQPIEPESHVIEDDDYKVTIERK